VLERWKSSDLESVRGHQRDAYRRDSAGEAPSGTVVATDTASVDANYTTVLPFTVRLEPGGTTRLR
jgi:hypothetical protein